MATLRGISGMLFICISTLLHACILLPLGLLKFLAPEGPARQRVRHWLARVAQSWIGANNFLLSTQKTNWQIELPPGLDPRGCYLVISNHQTWVDILVLQRCFNGVLPLMRFFLKKQLIWVPVIGLCWWALDFPFMNRPSREAVARNPSLRGADLESARQACEKFSTVPVAMMSFVEGTRFTEHKAVDSRYQNLLNPKSGGVGQVLYAMGDRIQGCVDVTIAYPGYGAAQAPTFWDLLCGQIPQVVVNVQLRPIPAGLAGINFREDEDARFMLNEWLGDMWTEKDQRLDNRAASDSA